MEDNQGAISYATNVVISDMTKHIDVKWQSVKDQVEACTDKVNYIATDLNTADMMTKPEPRPALEKHARFAMGCNGRSIYKPVETAYMHVNSSGYRWGAILTQTTEARGF
eukprot:jgi/Tetstr1/440160/TSEL_028516.t1